MKIKPNRKRLKITGLLLLLFVGGGYLTLKVMTRLDIEQMHPGLTQPVQITNSLVQLSPQTVKRIGEIGLLHAPVGANGVVSLTQTNAGKYLLVMYGNGIFRRWGMENQERLEEFDFIDANRNGTNFSIDGSMIVTPGKVLSEGLNGYNVWNTKTGERLYCWGPQCPGGDPTDSQFVDTGIVLDKQGKWIMTFDDGGMGIKGLKENYSSIVSLDDPDDNVKIHLSRIVEDQSGNYIAYSLEEGTIEIDRSEEFVGTRHGFILKDRKFGKFQAQERIRTIDMAFDDTNTWFVWLNEKELTVWNLQELVSLQQLQIPVVDGESIAFNHMGNLLVVGTKKGFMIFDPARRTEIAVFDVGEVTALYFTQDDRALMWGDTQGQIHIWGENQDP